LQECWDDIWALLEEGDSDAAAKAALEALNELGDEPELRYLLGVSLLDLDEIGAALTELEKVVDDAPEWAEAQNALAWACFRTCDFAAATEAVAAALELDPKLPEAHQLRGLLAERGGDEALAIEAFAQARVLAPDLYPEPFEMDEDEFLEVAQEAIAELDERTVKVLEETAMFVQPFPAEDLLRDDDPPLDPQILGLFLGRNLLEQSVQDSGTLPNSIYLFQRNIERTATSRDELEEEIRITVLHEIAHHFGWDEAELEERGFA
jgi:predicted Zn-dependent protease with MMP-like domain